jgi:ABC-2 type transport system ATP-binding protein
VYVEVDNLKRAAAILGDLTGVVEVAREGSGLSIRLDGLEREALVAELVRHGIGVETITPRHRLEDVFLDLLGEERR